jgi:hypothetical protein
MVTPTIHSSDHHVAALSSVIHQASVVFNRGNLVERWDAI